MATKLAPGVQRLKGQLNNKIVVVYPELENLTVIPSIYEQHFKSEKYGYETVTVKAVESEELNIVPSAEEQVKEGLFNKVTIAGDSNLVPENIKEGTNVFGVNGTGKMLDIKITDARYLFYQGARLDYMNEILKLSENITNMSYMFCNCNNLTETELDLSKFDTSNVTDMNYMFSVCRGLTRLILTHFDTSKVVSVASMFNNCTSLSELDLSSFDMSNVNSIHSMFNNCSSLVNLKSFKNLGKGYTQQSANYLSYKLILSDCTKLTYESLIDVITNGLYDLNLTYDIANGGTLYRQSCVLGSTNLAKLQATEEGLQALADADAKGWDVT